MVVKRPSVIKRLIPHTAGSLVTTQSLYQKHSQVSNGVHSDRKRVKFDKNSYSQCETKVSSKPTSDTSQLDITYSALAKLLRKGSESIE